MSNAEASDRLVQIAQETIEQGIETLQQRPQNRASWALENISAESIAQFVADAAAGPALISRIGSDQTPNDVPTETLRAICQDIQNTVCNPIKEEVLHLTQKEKGE